LQYDDVLGKGASKDLWVSNMGLRCCIAVWWCTGQRDFQDCVSYLSCL
jgi:hypothetical protein